LDRNGDYFVDFGWRVLLHLGGGFYCIWVAGFTAFASGFYWLLWLICLHSGANFILLFVIYLKYKIETIKINIDIDNDIII
jgi:hypothetical protein